MNFARGVLVALVVLLAASLTGQAPAPAPQIHFVTVDPAGACSASYVTVNRTTGTHMGCIAGTWASIGGGSSSDPTKSGGIYFQGLTSGGYALATKDVGGGPVTYLFPADDGTGKFLKDTGVVTCSSVSTLPAGFPNVCHQFAWDIGPGGGAVSSVTGASGVTCTPTTGSVVCSPDFLYLKTQTILELPMASIISAGTQYPAGGWISWTTTGCTMSTRGTTDTQIATALCTQAQALANRFRVPDKWDASAITMKLNWFPNAAGTNGQIITYKVQTVCDPASYLSITYGTATETQITVSNAAAGTSRNDTLNVPITGCVAGSEMLLKLSRNGTGETLTVDAALVTATMIFNTYLQ